MALTMQLFSFSASLILRYEQELAGSWRHLRGTVSSGMHELSSRILETSPSSDPLPDAPLELAKPFHKPLAPLRFLVSLSSQWTMSREQTQWGLSVHSVMALVPVLSRY